LATVKPIYGARRTFGISGMSCAPAGLSSTTAVTAMTPQGMFHCHFLPGATLGLVPIGDRIGE
jgi:hypothetical protein